MHMTLVHRTQRVEFFAIFCTRPVL